MKLKSLIKNILRKILPAYHVSLRVEEELYKLEYNIKLMNTRQEMMFWYLLRENKEPLIDTQKRFYKNISKVEGLLRIHQLNLLQLMTKIDEICCIIHMLGW